MSRFTPPKKPMMSGGPRRRRPGWPTDHPFTVLSGEGAGGSESQVAPGLRVSDGTADPSRAPDCIQCGDTGVLLRMKGRLSVEVPCSSCCSCDFICQRPDACPRPEYDGRGNRIAGDR